MNSAIYTGKVRHRRFQPTPHSFKYRLYLNWLDLSEIPDLFNIPFILGSGKLPSLISFNRKKYMSPDKGNLTEAVKDKIEEHLDFRPEGKVFILTTLQYLGFCFNPVSFYYAYDFENRLQAVAAEITNTPWDERFTYCLDLRNKHNHEFSKEFHVSPFMPMEIDYKWSFPAPSNNLAVHMQNFKQNELQFDATLKLKRKSFSKFTMLLYATLMPLLPFKVVAGIYWHAFRLWLKKVPFYSNPKNQDSLKECSHE
ncbi:MAG: DUF1365 domain-containing protein [Lentisphaeraceae bacterium]|nr:DUF1365 domain-containing protein [Lentisphaeraceae bacterium]